MGREGGTCVSLFITPVTLQLASDPLLDRCKQWPSERLSVFPKDTQDQIYEYNSKPLEVGLISCPFSRVIVLVSSSGPISYLTY